MQRFSLPDRKILTHVLKDSETSLEVIFKSKNRPA